MVQINSYEASIGAKQFMSFNNNNASAVVHSTVMPTKSDSDVIFCLQFLSKTLTCTLHLTYPESIDHVCINLTRAIYRS